MIDCTLDTKRLVKMKELTKELSVALAQLDDWLEKNSPIVAAKARPPLTRQQIEQVAKELHLNFSEDFYRLYQWHNGYDDGAQLIYYYNFMPLEEAVKDYRLMMELNNEFPVYEEIWRHAWFPILGFMGEFYLVDCNIGAARSCPILHWFSQSGVTMDGLPFGFLFLLVHKRC